MSARPWFMYLFCALAFLVSVALFREGQRRRAEGQRACWSRGGELRRDAVGDDVCVGVRP